MAEFMRASAQVISIPEVPLQRLEMLGRVCYKSEDAITPGSSERFCKNLLSRQHESVIEHLSATVRFIVDRGVSHELVRHRLAAYSQESTRYCNYGRRGAVTFIIPPWIEWEKQDTAGTNTWRSTMEIAEVAYLSLLEMGWKPEQARSVLPNSLKTEIVATMNFREWRHVFKLRTAKNAHPQMREVMVPLLDDFKRLVTVLFDDISLGE